MLCIGQSALFMKLIKAKDTKNNVFSFRMVLDVCYLEQGDAVIEHIYIIMYSFFALFIA